MNWELLAGEGIVKRSFQGQFSEREREISNMLLIRSLNDT